MAIRVAYLTCEVPGRLDSVRGLKQPRLVPQGGAMSTQTMEPRLELEQNLHMYRQMAKIRAFDEQVNELYKSAKMPGLAHLYIGEEAVAVGVCEALRRDDLITSTHRGHGLCLAKGAAVNRMFAELLGKEPGYCRGKGGSMHIADPETGNLGANAIVGASSSGRGAARGRPSSSARPTGTTATTSATSTASTARGRKSGSGCRSTTRSRRWPHGSRRKGSPTRACSSGS